MRSVLAPPRSARVAAPARRSPEHRHPKHHLVEIDVLKGVAIVAVLVQHGLPTAGLHTIAAGLWINQAVPVFFILMGFNAARAHARRDRPLPVGEYWRGRLRRLGIPFAAAFAASVLVGAIAGGLTWGPTILLGRLP